MKKAAVVTGVLALLLFGAGQATAGVLLDVLNSPALSATQETLNFTATGTTSDIAFAGYNVPSVDYAEDISLTNTTTGSTSNLLGLTWNYTAAASGSDSSQFNDGDGTGTNGLDLAGTSVGYYDTYDQTITTVAGDQYALSFQLQVLTGGSNENELIVSASNASTGIPEPATLFLFGSGLLGVAIAARKRRKA